MCRKSFESTTAETMPFCGSRCREIDMGRWLGERYAFPTSRTGDDDESGEEEPPAEDE
ncbi:MAG: DNA gyrase inhibitor YacG [Planctomycetaceae bacterium]|nr:DNA gyrase inhibitor YacG [Planctomycetaceae bacterium]